MQRNIGTACMITLALVAQPLQYAVAASIDQQVKALTSATVGKSAYNTSTTTTSAVMASGRLGSGIGPCMTGNGDIIPPAGYMYDDTCQIVPKPYTPPATPTSTVKYYLLAGINDQNPVGTESTYFSKTNLPQFLNASANKGIPVNTSAPFASWSSQNLTVQGSNLKSSIETSTTSADSVILIGHSMGGLRARSALQIASNANQLPQVKALVTMGTPNQGAPILNNAKPVLTELGTVFGGVLGGFTVIPVYLTGALGAFGLRNSVNSLVDSPSGTDMKPGSAFLSKLNTQANPLRSSMIVMDVIGQNNNIDAYGASSGLFATTDATRKARESVGKAMTVLGVGALGLGPVTLGFGLLWAAALFAAAYLMFNLPTFWRNNVVGEATGDGVVPQSSQFIPASAGGNRTAIGTTYLPNAVHTGRYGEYQAQSSDGYIDNVTLQNQLLRLQRTISIPTSQ